MLKSLLERVRERERLCSRSLQPGLSLGMVLTCMALSSYLLSPQLDEVHGVFYGFGDTNGLYFGEAAFTEGIDAYPVFTRAQVFV